MSRSLGLAHLTIEEASPEDLVEAAARAGFAAVGMRICGFAPEADAVGLIGDRRRRRALRRRIDDAGLALLNVCSFRLTEGIDAAAYDPVIEVCAELGAPVLLLTCFLADSTARADLLAALAGRAAGSGVRVGLEFFRSSALRSLDEAETLRRPLAGRVGHVLDALHVFRAGHAVADLAALDPASILGIQICDGPARAPAGEALRAEIRDRLPPGAGGLPLRAFVSALPAHLPLEIECPVRADVGSPLLDRARRARRAGEAFLETLARGTPA